MAYIGKMKFKVFMISLAVDTRVGRDGDKWFVDARVVTVL